MSRWRVTEPVDAGAMGRYEPGMIVDVTDDHAGWLVARYGPQVLVPVPDAGADTSSDDDADVTVTDADTPARPVRRRRTGGEA